MRLFGIIGFPLGHSFSQQYFTRKFREEHISGCRYEAFSIHSIEELPGLIQTHPGLEGLNVTIPYKKQVIGLLDDRSQIPPGLDACNCIRIVNGKLLGYNTDVVGFRRSLETVLHPSLDKALVLGSGGASAAVCFVLKELDIPYRIVSREKMEGGLTYTELDSDIMRSHRLIINTTPLGTYPEIEVCPDIPYHLLGPGHFLFDLVYNPEKTLFLQKGEEKGAGIKNGYDMLVFQAEESWKIWNA